MMFGSNWYSIQEVLCGNEKVLSNKYMSDWLAVKYLPRLNDLDNMPDMSLSLLIILRILRDNAPETCMCMPSNQRRQDVRIEFDVCNLVFHATTKILS